MNELVTIWQYILSAQVFLDLIIMIIIKILFIYAAFSCVKWL